MVNTTERRNKFIFEVRPSYCLLYYLQFTAFREYYRLAGSYSRRNILDRTLPTFAENETRSHVVAVILQYLEEALINLLP